MGDHLDNRNGKRAKLKEHDPLARRRKATFKQYLRNIEDDLLEDDLSADDPIDEKLQDDSDEE